MMTFLRNRSFAARLVMVLVLTLFIVMCGLHLGGAHHDGHGDGLVVALNVLLLSLLLVAAIMRLGLFPAHVAVVTPSDDGLPLDRYLMVLSPGPVQKVSILRC